MSCSQAASLNTRPSPPPPRIWTQSRRTERARRDNVPGGSALFGVSKRQHSADKMANQDKFKIQFCGTGANWLDPTTALKVAEPTPKFQKGPANYFYLGGPTTVSPAPIKYIMRLLKMSLSLYHCSRAAVFTISFGRRILSWKVLACHASSY